jgi:hypothetical protein
MHAAFQLVLTLYWLALSLWFGGVLLIALIVPIIFRTVRDANPTLPHVLSVNLDKQHAELLAGEISAAIIRLLSVIQLACAGVLLLMLIAHWFLIPVYDRLHVVSALLRSACYLAALALVLYDRYVVWPKALSARQEYIDHADEPDVANPARDRMLQYDRESARVLMLIVVGLSLMIAFSSNLTMRSTVLP